jgi:hypothetical protein
MNLGTKHHCISWLDVLYRAVGTTCKLVDHEKLIFYNDRKIFIDVIKPFKEFQTDPLLFLHTLTTGCRLRKLCNVWQQRWLWTMCGRPRQINVHRALLAPMIPVCDRFQRARCNLQLHPSWTRYKTVLSAWLVVRLVKKKVKLSL